METKTYKGSVVLNTTPHEVYEIFMDSQKHSQLTNSNAQISREVDGEFTVWDGSIHGKDLTLIPDKKIVQLWRAEDAGWPEGHFSTVTFIFTAQGDKTKLSITHKDIPVSDYKNVEQGWREYYLQALEKKFNS